MKTISKKMMLASLLIVAALAPMGAEAWMDCVLKEQVTLYNQMATWLAYVLPIAMRNFDKAASFPTVEEQNALNHVGMNMEVIMRANGCEECKSTSCPVHKLIKDIKTIVPEKENDVSRVKAVLFKILDQNYLNVKPVKIEKIIRDIKE